MTAQVHVWSGGINASWTIDPVGKKVSLRNNAKVNISLRTNACSLRHGKQSSFQASTTDVNFVSLLVMFGEGSNSFSFKDSSMLVFNSKLDICASHSHTQRLLLLRLMFADGATLANRSHSACHIKPKHDSSARKATAAAHAMNAWQIERVQVSKLTLAWMIF